MTVETKRRRGQRKGEIELIAAIRGHAARYRRGNSRMLVLGIGDDCAVLRPSRGRDLVVTTDLSLEGVHFRRDWHPPESVGHRCLARGLSDLAAMGARPEAAFLSIALPRELSGRWLERFLDGWMLLASRYGVPLAGGDTAESPSSTAKLRNGLVTADIVLVGSVPSGKALLRSGARAGDVIYVTGELGGAAAELRELAERPAASRKKDGAEHPHLYPEPRIAIGKRLVQSRLDTSAATSAIDISDGLSTDLAHICEASGLTAVIDAESVPVARHATLEEALHGGEDYELLFTAPPKMAAPAKLAGVPVRAIGRMTGRGHGIEIRAKNGARAPLRALGWEHFRS